MRIALVEDNAAEREELLFRLRAQLSRLRLVGEVLAYSNGRDFLAEARRRPFELLLLDIYLDGENGLDTARELRRFDKDCILVISTCSKDHALESFQLRALHYLVKPYSDQELSALFDEILRRIPVPDKYLELNSGGQVLRLRYSRILYAEHFRHQIYIYGSGGEHVVTRQTFRDFTDSLEDSRFFLCSRGVLVNLDYVEDFDGTDFILQNGIRLPVSRDQVKSARVAFGEQLFKKRSQS